MQIHGKTKDIIINKMITLRDRNGNITIQRSVNKSNDPIRKWKPREEVLAFIHIVKSGGTSFLEALENSVLEENHCKMQCFYNFKYLETKST